MNKSQAFLLIPIWFFFFSCTTYHYVPEITTGDLDHHLKFLASDELQGRYPGTAGDEKAGNYIESCFKELGLSVQRQDFSFLQAVKRGTGNFMEVNGSRSDPELYTPFSFSGDTLVNARVIFAGYGITVKTDSFVWDDYQGMDVTGKWVLILRGSPDLPGITDYLTMASDDRDKAMLAADNKAAGIIMVSGYHYDAPDDLVKVSGKPAAVGIPAFHVRRTLADEMLRSDNTNIRNIEDAIYSGKRDASFASRAGVNARSDVENVMGQTSNRFAWLEGSDPVLKEEYIIIGAHYDHLGTGGAGSSSRRPDTVAVHNGADDNASGVTAMLELAGKLKQNQQSLKRSVILAAFGAEEMGLLGSKYFVNHLPVEISKAVAMVNLDMVGRLDTLKGLQVEGTGTSIEADSIIALANRNFNIRLTLSREGSGPSDHSSFYGKNIPVFFITTGAHTDYHTPDDDAGRININGLLTVSGFTYGLVTAIADHPRKLNFREAGPSQSAVADYRFKVTLGFMPDFSDNDIEGVRVEFVSKGKAAERGGIKNGDIIKAIDGMPVMNIYDYMYRLGKLSRNQIISVEVQRDGRKEVLVIQL